MNASISVSGIRTARPILTVRKWPAAMALFRVDRLQDKRSHAARLERRIDIEKSFSCLPLARPAIVSAA
jgi:hypothetical protein